MSEFSNVFKQRIIYHKISLTLHDNATSVYTKECQILYTLAENVNKEDDLEKSGIKIIPNSGNSNASRRSACLH